MTSPLDARPIIVVVAGPNGAGKTTYHNAYLRTTGLRFLNADVLAHEFGSGTDGYAAAKLAEGMRRELVRQRESFILETVFSDPAGDKLAFLLAAARSGYTVVLCFIGISGPDVSDQRVAMRVSKGGHDVPIEKLIARFPRTMANLRAAIQRLAHVWIFDNDDLGDPFRPVARFESGRRLMSVDPVPEWLAPVLPAGS